MLLTVSDIAALKDTLKVWRAAGDRVAFVPTMGNLHAGHMQLVSQGRKVAERVVVSVFVNPAQFGPSEDFAAYPRTAEADAQLLEAHGADLLFVPDDITMYGHGCADNTFVEVPGLSDVLCGRSRPGHFRGVATVVLKLFNLVRPDVALFGSKDFQQLAVIRRMVADLNVPVDILGVPTVRAEDGLALSSRNGYLTSEERSLAPVLYATLVWLASELRLDAARWRELEQEGARRLELAGFRPDYLVVRQADDLAEPEGSAQRLVVLAAAWLGKTRLIDNLEID
ncbi:MAG: hypothetical protein RIQ52_361 [Pseudomonadota bacterium]